MAKRAGAVVIILSYVNLNLRSAASEGELARTRCGAWSTSARRRRRAGPTAVLVLSTRYSLES
jgi:hypothetical protein